MKYVQIKLPDNFEKGQCLDCPFGYVTDDADILCVFFCRYNECPLEIKSDGESEELDADSN